MSTNLQPIYGFISEQFVIAPGATKAVSAIDGQLYVRVKQLSGGTFAVGGLYSLSNGASIGLGTTTAYIMSASEVLETPMRGTFYLAAAGSTVTALVLRGLSDTNG